MAKIDLKKSLGFSIILDTDLLIPQDLNFAKAVTVDIDKVRPQLLNEELSYPETFYKKYLKLDQDNILEKKKIRVNTYVIPQNLAGIEYVKTRAMQVVDHHKIIEVQYGGGVLIMQKYISPLENDTIVTKIKRDDKVIIPAGYTHAFVNTRQSVLVLSEVYSEGVRHKFVLDEMKGMAYYVIRKNAKQEIVQNPNYRQVNDYRKVKWEEVVQRQNITLRTPVLKQVLRKYEKFSWLFKDSPIDI